MVFPNKKQPKRHTHPAAYAFRPVFAGIRRRRKSAELPQALALRGGLGAHADDGGLRRGAVEPAC